MSSFQPEHVLHVLAPLGDANRVWVAFSGGLDSTVLLHAAAATRECMPGPLSAIHVDHRLQPQSPGWAAHCKDLCSRLGIPCVIKTVEVRRGPGDSLESAAREARYRALAEALSPGDLMLTAHTMDDQAETLLLALMRGSGAHGLAAMPAIANLGPGRLVRPLLGVSRAALEDYASFRGLAWVQDPSNESLAFDRNFLRHRILPALRERWPAASAALARSAAHCAEAAELTDGIAEKALTRLVGARPGTVSIPALEALDLPLRRAVLRLWIQRQGYPRPRRIHLERILAEVLTARPDANPLVSWQGCEIRRYRQDLIAMPPLPAPPRGIELRWEGTTLELPRPLGGLQRPPESSHRPLAVRFGVGALACRPPGRAHRRSLKKLMQDAAIPAWLRPYLPMLFDGEVLVGIAGLCRCTPGPETRPDTAAGIHWHGHPWTGLGWLRQTID